MASPSQQPTTAPQSAPPHSTAASRPSSSQQDSLSAVNPVELSTLQAAPGPPTTDDMATTLATSVTSAKAGPPANLTRAETEAIGPSTDTPALDPDNTNGPTLVIMLLLTTGARHPYKIDERYLKKRNVTVEAMDPYNISVYTLKELIWRDWREEWETRPISPSSIRLIHFGRMLDDNSPLKDCRFQTDTPNVVHMTVKPQEVVDDEENAKTGKAASRRDNEDEPTAGCRCVIL